MDVLHQDVEVDFILEGLHEPHDIWEYGLFEDGSFVCHGGLQLLLADDLFGNDLQRIEVAAILAILDQQHFPELSLSDLPEKGEVVEVQLVTVESQSLMQFVLEDEHAGVTVEFFEEFLHPLEGEKTTIPVSIFDQVIARVGLIQPVRLVEDDSLLLLVDSAFQTYHKPLVDPLIQHCPLLHEDRLELDDGAMDLGGSQ